MFQSFVFFYSVTVVSETVYTVWQVQDAQWCVCSLDLLNFSISTQVSSHAERSPAHSQKRPGIKASLKTPPPPPAQLCALSQSASADSTLAVGICARDPDRHPPKCAHGTWEVQVRVSASPWVGLCHPWQPQPQPALLFTTVACTFARPLQDVLGTYTEMDRYPLPWLGQKKNYQSLLCKHRCASPLRRSARARKGEGGWARDWVL